MRASDFYDLVSGRRRGAAALLTRLGLLAAEGPYRAGVWWRNRFYDTRPQLTHAAPAPVVSVGNLTLGGTGKTPMVRWVAQRLREHGVRVALVSRGYGADDGGPNDEALELEQSLPDVPHLQNPDRVSAATAAVEELAAEAIVLDDGFQHRRLVRDLDIVLVDATCPFGFGHVFPRGTLREPFANVRRADVVCLTRSDQVERPTCDNVRERVARHAPDAVWCESITRPARLIEALAGAGPYDEAACDVGPAADLSGRRVVAVSAIGNPAAFRRTVESLGARVVEAVEYPDHHRYTRDDIDRLSAVARSASAETLVCTHKDLVKIGVPAVGDTPVRAVTIEVAFTVGEDALRERLSRVACVALANPE
ncbi:MAG: tetraacyldisaccharide 4'-kinase [Planctomycetota bacterium]